MCLRNAKMFSVNKPTKCYKVLLTDGTDLFMSPHQHEIYKLGETKRAEGKEEILMYKPADFIVVSSEEGKLGIKRDTRTWLEVGCGYLHVCESLMDAFSYVQSSWNPSEYSDICKKWVIVECEIPTGSETYRGAWEDEDVCCYATKVLEVKRPLLLDEVIENLKNDGFYVQPDGWILESFKSKYYVPGQCVENEL